MSRIVVTGGSGRLGRSVVTALHEAGHDVVNLDRIPDPGSPARQIDVDLTDQQAVATTLRELRPDAVVHLAAIAVPFSAPEEQILRVNVSMAYAVVTEAVAAGATRILVASSPTVVGYGAPRGWSPTRLPIDESTPLAPWNAYSVSKESVEAVVRMAARRDGDRAVFGAFRPCFVISPEEWAGAPTQQGHTVRARIEDPGLAAVSLFNYVDARDAADFVLVWLDRADETMNGDVFFVGAQDALARVPLADLLPRYLPGIASLASGLQGDLPAFDSGKADRLLGWRARRSWRTELRGDGSQLDQRKELA